MKRKFPKDVIVGLNIVRTGSGRYGNQGYRAFINRIDGFEESLFLDDHFLKKFDSIDSKFSNQILKWCSKNFEEPAFIEQCFGHFSNCIYFHSRNDAFKFKLACL